MLKMGKCEGDKGAHARTRVSQNVSRGFPHYFGQSTGFSISCCKLLLFFSPFQAAAEKSAKLRILYEIDKSQVYVVKACEIELVCCM